MQMDLRQLIKEYLQKPRVMQLATCVDNQPWACNVHFYVDENFNFYWVSMTDRRHSLELEKNPKAAITVKIHEDTPEENYVIGISAEGEAAQIGMEEIKKIGEKYINRLSKKPKLLEDILAESGGFTFYKFIPSKLVLFDIKNFPDDPRQEVSL